MRTAVILLAAVLASLPAALGGTCTPCSLTMRSLARAHEELGAPSTEAGSSICDRVASHLEDACHSLAGHLGADVLASAASHSGAESLCSLRGLCPPSANLQGSDPSYADNVLDSSTVVNTNNADRDNAINSDDNDDDELWALTDGDLKPDNEDKENDRASVEETKVSSGARSELQKDNAGDAEARRRAEVAEAKREGDVKVAAALKKATAQFKNATSTAVELARAKAVAEAKKKWEHSWRRRVWPVNVGVPAKASKLPCTKASLGRIAFRQNTFFGCQTHCVQQCKQCNCREEEKVVEDADCKCFKRVKKEVCDSCCENKCGPQWIAFTACARTCEQCDCKVEHGIKVCQSCCKEKCGPKWHKGPI